MVSMVTPSDLIIYCNMTAKGLTDIYVTGFWKTDQTVTLGLFHFIGQTNGYTCASIRLGCLVCFSRATFANPVNS